jgi:Phage integrase, N-terminal SAM-like domain
MTHLRQRMQEDLRPRNLPERTIRRYTLIVAEFAKYFHKSPDQQGPDHVRTLLLYLLHERKLAGCTVQGMRPALKFLYNQIPFQTAFEAILLDHVHFSAKSRPMSTRRACRRCCCNRRGCRCRRRWLFR